MISKKSVFAHVVHPDPRTAGFDNLRESKSLVSYNPTSNLKLGSSVSPIPGMVTAGVNIAFRKDSASRNNAYDIFRRIHLASIIYGGVRQSVGILNVYQVLEFPTINGAHALGL